MHKNWDACDVRTIQEKLPTTQELNDRIGGQERNRWEYEMRWREEKKWLNNHSKVLEVLEFGLCWKFKHDLSRSLRSLQAL